MILWLGDMEEFQQYFHQLFPELTSFSFALIPDELQANQMVLDAMSVLVVQEKEVIENYFQERVAINSRHEETGKLEFQRYRIKTSLYKNIFKIAFRRAPQLESSILPGEDKAAFYAVDLTSRAIVFLKHKTHFELTDIEDIVDKNNSEVISLLQIGRKSFIENLGLKELN